MADAPIYQLSTELLTEIFLWTRAIPSRLPNPSSNRGNHNCYDLIFRCHGQDRKMCTEATTLDISQTCSYWREIAIPIPSLWSRICVDLFCEERKFVNLLRLYIQRSSPALLTLTFLQYSGYRRAVETSLIERNSAHILRVVTEQKHRWRVVDLGEIPMYALIRHWDHFVQSATDCLDLEVVHFPDNTQSKDTLRFCDLFGTTPKLHTLSCPKKFVFHTFLLESLPLNQVTTINLTGGFFCTKFWGQLLQHCPNLRHLHFRGPATHVSRFYEVDPLILPHLQSLSVELGRDSDCRILPKILGHLKAPLLSTLQFRGYSELRYRQSIHTEKTLFDHLKGFLQRSGCQLRQLKLFGYMFSTQAVIEWSAELPTLEELTVAGGLYRLPLFKALTISSSSATSPEFNVLLPRLTKLEVTIVLESEDLETDSKAHGGSQKLDNDLDNGIYAMVRSRRRNTGTMDSATLLRSFSLSVSGRRRATIKPACASALKWLSNFHSETRPRLRELTQHGLELELDIRKEGTVWNRRE